MSVQPTTTSDVRSDVIKRLTQSAQRWRSIGKLSISRGDHGGHDSLRMSLRITAVVNVIRSKTYAEYADDVFLRKHAGRSAGELVDMIQDRLPGRKIPGYTERA